MKFYEKNNPLFIVKANLPESVVYELTKAIYKHEREIRELMAGFKDFGIQNALKWKKIPLNSLIDIVSNAEKLGSVAELCNFLGPRSLCI